MTDDPINKDTITGSIKQGLKNAIYAIDKNQSLPEVQTSINTLPEPLRSIASIVLPVLSHHLYNHV